LAQTIKLTGPVGKKLDHLALDAKRDRLYVANQGNGSLDVIDLKAGKVLKSIPDQAEIQGVIYVPGVDRVFAALGLGICNVFDADSLKLQKSLKVADADNVRHDPKSNLVWITTAGKKIASYDAKSLEAKGDIQLKASPESFVIEMSRPRMYVNTQATRQVAVVDTDKRTVLKTYELPEAGNYPIALDETNKRLLVGTRKEPMLFVLDTETGKQLSSLPIPNDVDDLYFDAKRKRLYASCGEGWLVVLKQVSADRYELMQKYQTVKQARTCLFDAETSRLFAPIPRGPGMDAPELRVYRVK
jgi:DNA-binding beta-propeller fold protein YncE